jgi:Mitochondrial ribosomal protein (VAR1)
MNNIKTDKNNVQNSNISVLYRPVGFKNRVLNRKYNKPIWGDNQIIETKKVLIDEPLIFNKMESPIKPLRYINNDTGKMRHFTPGAQEWFNNIYSYNKNYVKLLPIADKNIMNLLKTYFNFFINHKIIKTKRIANRYRKLSANKVFVGKGELKHTNEKLIITSYVYNAEQLYLKSITKKLTKSLYYPNKELKKYVNTDRNGKEIITFNRPFTLKEYLNLPDHHIWHENFCFTLFWKEYIKLIGMKKLKDEEKKEKKLKNDNNKNSVKFIDKTKKVFLDAFSHRIYNETTFKHFFNSLFKLVERKEENEKKLLKFELQVIKNKLFFDDFDKYITMARDNYLKTLKRFSYLLMVNSAKFEKPFAWKLLRLIKNIYNKEVQFNIVNLNKMHLNSDIYTQAVSLKLRNRDNKLFKVLTSSLSKVKLPNVSRISEKYNKSNRDEYLINKIRNVYVNSMFNNTTSMDPLNNLLLAFFSRTENLEMEIKNRSSIIKRPISLYKYIIRSLKHLKLAGIRIEAKGRLTRRFTASKSVFKVRWKGGLKNVDSSFKGLSAIMLRGDRKSNVQYSMLSSKNRNGAFGVKGWVSSK